MGREEGTVGGRKGWTEEGIQREKERRVRGREINGECERENERERRGRGKDGESVC